MERSKLFFDNVLGLSFSISAEADSAYLERLLDNYRHVLENTSETTGVSPREPLKLAILAGFLLCEEIEKMKNQSALEGKEAEQLTLDLITRIDEAIPDE